MENRILQIAIHDRALSPAQAEVWIHVVPQLRTATTEIRGRLMGPRCPYAGTVEVAYPLRPMPPINEPPRQSDLTVRVLIPEPSLWEPQCPFLYSGPIELWQDGHCCERIGISHGLRSLQRGGNEARVNGRPLTPRARRVVALTDEEATQWHEAGYNILIAPLAESSLSVWEQADRFGFLVLGQLGEDAQEERLVESLHPHASYLGWLHADCRALPAEDAVNWYIAHGNSGGDVIW